MSLPWRSDGDRGQRLLALPEGQLQPDGYAAKSAESQLRHRRYSVEERAEQVVTSCRHGLPIHHQAGHPDRVPTAGITASPRPNGSGYLPRSRGPAQLHPRRLDVRVERIALRRGDVHVYSGHAQAEQPGG